LSQRVIAAWLADQTIAPFPVSPFAPLARYFQVPLARIT
jgi:hypothetical protein